MNELMKMGRLRLATEKDVPALTQLINIAFNRESFFKKGDRIDEAGVSEKLGTGSMYVLDEGDTMIACIYLETNGELMRGESSGYIGLLAVDPSWQGRGLGKQMMSFAEGELQRRGCTRAQLRIINLRKELVDFYGRLGYSETDTTPYPFLEKLSQPAHFVNMEKML